MTTRILSIVLFAWTVASAAWAQSTTTFTYQGQLANAGVPVAGTADLRFRLYNSGGAQLGAQVEALGLTLENGTFTVPLDFGSVFATNPQALLEIDVRSPAGAGAFITLAPRRMLTATPVAMYAQDSQAAVSAQSAQRLAGISLVPGGSAVLDQDQSVRGTSSISLSYFAPEWQSFTAGKTGYLDHFSVSVGGTGDLKMTVYSGVGTSGPVLGSVTLNQVSRVVSGFFSGIQVTAGSTYTVGLSSSSSSFSIDLALSSIPGAIGSAKGAPVSFWFQSFVSSFPILGVQSVAVPWSGIIGNPWSGNSTGVACVGAVTVGTDLFMNTNHYFQFGADAENGDTIFLSRFNYAPNQSGLRMELGSDPSGTNAANDAFIITESGTVLFQFNTAGGGQAYKNGGGAWAALSDARAKHDINPLTGSLTKLLRLHGRSYFYNDPRAVGAGPGLHTGFVAQEVEPIFPEWIGTAPDGMKSIGITGFEALTVEALRDLRAEKHEQIAALKSESARKQAQIDALQSRLQAIEARLAVPATTSGR